MYNEPVKMLRSLKAGHGDNQKIWLEGEIVYPPLPTEIQQELRSSSPACVVFGKEPRKPMDRKVVKHFVPEVASEVDPILESVKKKTQELVEKESVVPVAPNPFPEPREGTATTEGLATHASAPSTVLKRRAR
jgi:hypothetical protein